MAQQDHSPRHMAPQHMSTQVPRTPTQVAPTQGDRVPVAQDSPASTTTQDGYPAPGAFGAGSGLFQAIFVWVALVALVLPLALMPVAPSASEAEKRALAPAPQLMGEKGPNPELLKDAGDYFTDHFAFRDLLVDLDATIKQRLLLTSATPNVVVGTEGWLYYSGELGDFQRSGLMSDAAISNAAHNLALVQEYLTKQGKRFALVVAPNKSTLYPEHMPYYFLCATGPTNYERLLPLLRDRGINVVNAAGLIAGKEELLYFERDSHWNDRGALVAYDGLMRALGKDPLAFDYENMRTAEHMGDLDGMLHPVWAAPEEQSRPGGLDSYTIANDATSVEDAYVVTATTREGAREALLMYRDSFANNLIAPLATTYNQAVFTKKVPYNLGSEQISFAQDVIIERAERHLASFASNPPFMPAPQRTLPTEGPARQTSTTCGCRTEGPYLVVEGSLAKDAFVTDPTGEGTQSMRQPPSDANVLAQLAFVDGDTRTYECFRLSASQGSEADFEGQATQASSLIEGDAGYRAYVMMGEAELNALQNVRILVGAATEAHEVARVTYPH